MYRSFARRALGSTAILAAALLMVSCGSDGGPTEPDPTPTPDPTPEPTPTPTVEGRPIYAVDLSNKLLVFGTESAETIARSTVISGLPTLNRIVEIDFRPSDGKLYGVGNDSRVYTIDPATAEATPVSSEPFTPGIASFFDIHFGMSFHPVTERLRLISGDFGVSWSIDPDDGTAEAGPAVEVAEGDPHEGATLHLAGLTAVPAGLGGSSIVADGSQGAVCQIVDALFLAIDPDLGALFSTCDQNAGVWESLGDFPAALRCTQIKFDYEDGNLWLSVVESGKQHLYKLDPFTFDVQGSVQEVPANSPIQGFAFPPAGSDASLVASALGAEAASYAAASLSSVGSGPSPDLADQCAGES
jgi:hypothetical protein